MLKTFNITLEQCMEAPWAVSVGFPRSFLQKRPKGDSLTLLGGLNLKPSCTCGDLSNPARLKNKLWGGCPAKGLDNHSWEFT